MLKFLFLDFGFGRIDMTDILRKSDVKSRRQDQSIRHSQTALLRARKNVPITSNVGCDWWFSIRLNPLPVTRKFTVVNLHSLLGQFSSLVLEQTESSD